MTPTIEQPVAARNSLSSMLPAHYAQASSWLTYHEWKRLTERARLRAAGAVNTPGPDFTEALNASNLPAKVKFTLTVMHDHSDRDGHLSISKSALANMLGVNDHTIRRHWRAAEAARFLTKYDYPMDQKRPSDLWLWAGNAPARDTSWDKYDTGPMQDSPTPFQGW